MIGCTHDAQGRQPWYELIGKFLAGPVVIDNRSDLALHEGPHAVHQRLVFLADGWNNLVKVSVGSWKCFRGRNAHCDFLLNAGSLTITCKFAPEEGATLIRGYATKRSVVC